LILVLTHFSGSSNPKTENKFLKIGQELSELKIGGTPVHRRVGVKGIK
jgi:hypothetical protein